MLIVKFLHIATMFTAVALSLGPAVLIRFVARNRNARSIQAVAEGSASLARFIGPIFALGVIFGLVTVFVGGFDFLAPWLIVAYVLFAVGIAVGAGGEGPWTAEVARAAAANAEPTAGPALVGLLTSQRANFLFWAFALILLALIFDMVVKPFS
jgi:hypothetical protein